MSEARIPLLRKPVGRLHSALLLVLLMLPGTARAADGWVRVESAHVSVLAHTTESSARRMASELESARRALRAALGAPEEDRVVHLVVFSSRREFEPFLPLFDGRPGSVPGYSLVGPQRNYILLAADTEPATVLLHEYAHLFLHQRYGHLPVWLEEGLGEFFSSARATERECWLGELHPRHLEQLRRAPLLPLNIFFSVTQRSPLYGDRKNSNLFYAQAWATAHFLLLGGARPEFGKLAELARALAAGQEAGKAISEVFGVPADRLGSSLQAYLQQATWPRLRLSLEARAPAPVEFSTATEREVAFHLADVFAQAERLDEARERLNTAAGRFPDFAPIEELLGWMALWRDDAAAAERHFERAIAAGSKDPEVLFLHAKLLFGRKLKEIEAEASNSAVLAVVQRELGRALVLNPRDARARDLLGFTFLISPAETDAAIREFEQAVALSPAVALYRVHLAQAYLQKGKLARAREVLEQALRLASEPGVRASIEQMLHYLTTVEPRP